MFSPRESEILKLLTHEPTYIVTISTKLKVDNNSIGLSIRRINRKVNDFDLDWEVRGDGLGRGGKKVWLAKRKQRREQ